MEKTGGAEAKETARFVDFFDKFYDCLNVSNFTNGTRYNKKFQHPYRHGEDPRLKVCTAHADVNLVSTLYIVVVASLSEVFGRLGRQRACSSRS